MKNAFSKLKRGERVYFNHPRVLPSRVLWRHYHAVNLPARAKTADEMESAALTERVMDDLLIGLASENDADYTTPFAAFGSEKRHGMEYFHLSLHPCGAGSAGVAKKKPQRDIRMKKRSCDF